MPAIGVAPRLPMSRSTWPRGRWRGTTHGPPEACHWLKCPTLSLIGSHTIRLSLPHGVGRLALDAAYRGVPAWADSCNSRPARRHGSCLFSQILSTKNTIAALRS
jgi:hypothetical protein